MTIDKYSKLGIKIFIIADVPELKEHPYNIYSDAYKNKDIKNFLDNKRVNIREFNEEYKYNLKLLNNLVKKIKLKFFSLILLCVKKCVIGEIKQPFYKDANHLNFEGSKLLKEDLTNFFQKHQN